MDFILLSHGRRDVDVTDEEKFILSSVERKSDARRDYK